MCIHICYICIYIYIHMYICAARADASSKLSVCVLCGSPVWPSSPVVGPLWGPPLCVGPLFGSPVRVPSVWVPCVGPLCGSPVWVPCVGPSARRVASCGIYSRDVSRSFTRFRLKTVQLLNALAISAPFPGAHENMGLTRWCVCI